MCQRLRAHLTQIALSSGNRHQGSCASRRVIKLSLMSDTETTARYSGVEFYAEKTRKNGSLCGTVLVVNRAIRNGQAFAAIGMPRDGRKALPIATWTTDAYLARLGVKVTEAQAREIAPDMFRAIDSHERSPEYRVMYDIERAKPGRSPLQPAFPVASQMRVNVAQLFHNLYGA